MRFGWKFLIPVTLAWVVAVAFIRGAQLGFFGGDRILIAGIEFSVATLIIVSVVAVIALAVAWVWDGKREARLAAAEVSPPEEIDPFAGGYPVPPLPGQRLREPAPALAAHRSDTVTTTASTTTGTTTGTTTTATEEETRG
jgi:NADH-quinone oxidoreductase subunit H